MPIKHNCLRGAAIIAALCMAGMSARTFAQSLGDVARRAGEQRSQAGTKVYTNDSLTAVESPSTASPQADAETPKPAAEQAPALPPASGFTLVEDAATGHTNMKTGPAPEKRDEQYWRKTIGNIRTRIEAIERDIAAQQQKFDSIVANTPSAVREREVIAESIRQLETGLTAQKADLTRWLTRAGMAKVPEDWIK